MKEQYNGNEFSRRSFLKKSTTALTGIALLPYINSGCQRRDDLIKRDFGRCNFEVTTFGLGGQASLQWTPEDVDPVKIILKAFDKKVNYFDTSNVYGPSQLNFGKAFKELDLLPGKAGYNEKLRRSIFLTTKTHLRWAGSNPEFEGVRSRSDGNSEGGAVSDIKRSLSQMFGDGKGNYPEGAYLDMILIHNLNTSEEVNALYTGLYNTDPEVENIGALAALRDYRDGTNLTGTNPDEERLIRHIGFSGHFSAPVMMEMIQRDKDDILDAMLVAVNANDLLNLNMQHNVIPVARAKNMGIIAMKVFADGAMYSKEPVWSNEPDHVVRTVGSSELASGSLIQYVLTTPGISTAIIGIGEISDDPQKCQLTQNIADAQVGQHEMSRGDRKAIENMAGEVKEGKTNYFQEKEGHLTAPRNISVDQSKDQEKRIVRIRWDTAYAGDEPLKNYVVYRDDKELAKVRHYPQISQEPFIYEDIVSDDKMHNYWIESVDEAGRTKHSEIKKAEAVT